ncbi:MAG: hypothetical protein AVDCRST_MAG28-3639 [uncultured Rubrobacteraceae bacterium]|uniref:Uncharacterized protein n=1 Tax=uncultured Rubrobacteraceae bacterium TaxID=349277 RepID=A0A6J4R6K9_9ACTN|nr:MAG: hypothetical protein AVDCRST_MAG28-3639 [uncultured Rubrobacteraceae bacterium]
MKISSGSKTLTSRFGTNGSASQGLAAVRPLGEEPEATPECGEAARRVYSVPGFKVLSGA